MSPSEPPDGDAVPEDIPAAARKLALPTGMVPLVWATSSRVRLISRAPQRTRPSSPVSGTSGKPAATASSPIGTSASLRHVFPLFGGHLVPVQVRRHAEPGTRSD